MEGMFDPGLLAEPLDVFAFDVEPAEPEQSREVAMKPGRGTFFDEFIEIRDPEGLAFTERVLVDFDAVRPRQRKRNQAAQANHTERISRLLANVMRVHFHRALPSVLYFRKADAEWYESSPSWMQPCSLPRCRAATSAPRSRPQLDGMILAVKSMKPAS
jgi:hypothetical protein